MNNKRTALISVIVSLVVTLGWQLTPLSAYASRISTAASIQDPSPPSDPATPTWEYKILIYASFAASRRSLGYPATGYAPPNLEDEINKLAEQGYLVERFQTQSMTNGGGYGDGCFSISGSSDLVVLLKRQKK